MKTGLCLAALIVGLGSTAALAQGNSPYNTSGPQAGGPRAGMERSMGASGGTPDGAMAGQPMMKKKPMMRKKRMMKKRSM